MDATPYNIPFESIEFIGEPNRDSLKAGPTLLARVYSSFQIAVIDPVVLLTSWPVTGVDISSWQGNIDWDKMATKVQFVFMRAGIGNDVMDPTFEANFKAAKDRKIPVGLYWYLKPDKSALKTADSFARTNKGFPGEIFPASDMETTGGLDKSGLANWVMKYTKNFEEALNISDLHGGYFDHIFYTSPGFSNPYYQTEMADIKWRRLWEAQWSDTLQAPTLPLIWKNKDWLFWQWTSKGNGVDFGAQSINIDRVRCRMSIDGFNQLFKTSIKPLPDDSGTPPPPPVVIPRYVVVDTDRLNLRPIPNAAPIADTWKGMKWKTTGNYTVDAAGRGYWYQVTNGDGAGVMAG